MAKSTLQKRRLAGHFEEATLQPDAVVALVGLKRVEAGDCDYDTPAAFRRIIRVLAQGETWVTYDVYGTGYRPNWLIAMLVDAHVRPFCSTHLGCDVHFAGFNWEAL